MSVPVFQGFSCFYHSSCERRANHADQGFIRARPRGTGLLPPWKGEFPPLVQATNHLQVSLLGFETGARNAPEQPAAGSAGTGMTVVQLQVLENGEPTRAWQPLVVSLAASTREVRTQSLGTNSNGISRVVFPGDLWQEDGAWKMRVKLSRQFDFQTEDLWVFHDVPVPATRGLTEVNAKTNRFGEQIEFLGLSAPHARLPGEWVGDRVTYKLHARVPHPLPGLHFTLVDIRDDQGLPIKVNGMTEVPSTGGRGATMRETDIGYALALNEASKSLNITFALSREYEVEFLVQPTIAPRHRP